MKSMRQSLMPPMREFNCLWELNGLSTATARNVSHNTRLNKTRCCDISCRKDYQMNSPPPPQSKIERVTLKNHLDAFQMPEVCVPSEKKFYDVRSAGEFLENNRIIVQREMNEREAIGRELGLGIMSPRLIPNEKSRGRYLTWNDSSYAASGIHHQKCSSISVSSLPWSNNQNKNADLYLRKCYIDYPAAGIPTSRGTEDSVSALIVGPSLNFLSGGESENVLIQTLNTSKRRMKDNIVLQDWGDCAGQRPETWGGGVRRYQRVVQHEKNSTPINSKKYEYKKASSYSDKCGNQYGDISAITAAASAVVPFFPSTVPPNLKNIPYSSHGVIRSNRKELYSDHRDHIRALMSHENKGKPIANGMPEYNQSSHGKYRDNTKEVLFVYSQAAGNPSGKLNGYYPSPNSKMSVQDSFIHSEFQKSLRSPMAKKVTPKSRSQFSAEDASRLKSMGLNLNEEDIKMLKRQDRLNIYESMKITNNSTRSKTPQLSTTKSKYEHPHNEIPCSGRTRSVSLGTKAANRKSIYTALRRANYDTKYNKYAEENIKGSSMPSWIRNYGVSGAMLKYPKPLDYPAYVSEENGVDKFTTSGIQWFEEIVGDNYDDLSKNKISRFDVKTQRIISSCNCHCCRAATLMATGVQSGIAPCRCCECCQMKEYGELYKNSPAVQGKFKAQHISHDTWCASCGKYFTIFEKSAEELTSHKIDKKFQLLCPVCFGSSKKGELKPRAEKATLCSDESEIKPDTDEASPNTPSPNPSQKKSRSFGQGMYMNNGKPNIRMRDGSSSPTRDLDEDLEQPSSGISTCSLLTPFRCCSPTESELVSSSSEATKRRLERAGAYHRQNPFENPRILSKICQFLSLSQLLVVRECSKQFLVAAQYEMRYVLYKTLNHLLNGSDSTNMPKNGTCPLSADALIKLLELNGAEVKAIRSGELPRRCAPEACRPRMKEAVQSARLWFKRAQINEARRKSRERPHRRYHSHDQRHGNVEFSRGVSPEIRKQSRSLSPGAGRNLSQKRGRSLSVSAGIKGDRSGNSPDNSKTIPCINWKRSTERINELVETHIKSNIGLPKKSISKRDIGLSPPQTTRIAFDELIGRTRQNQELNLAKNIYACSKTQVQSRFNGPRIEPPQFNAPITSAPLQLLNEADFSSEPSSFRRVRHAFIKLWNYDPNTVKVHLHRATYIPYPSYLFDVSSVILKSVFQVCCNSVSSPSINSVLSMLRSREINQKNSNNYLWSKMADLSGFRIRYSEHYDCLSSKIFMPKSHNPTNMETILIPVLLDEVCRTDMNVWDIPHTQNAVGKRVNVNIANLIPPSSYNLRPAVIDSLETKMSKISPDFINEFLIYGRHLQELHGHGDQFPSRRRAVKVQPSLEILFDFYEWLAAVLTHLQRYLGTIALKQRKRSPTVSRPVKHVTGKKPLQRQVGADQTAVSSLISKRTREKQNYLSGSSVRCLRRSEPSVWKDDTSSHKINGGFKSSGQRLQTSGKTTLQQNPRSTASSNDISHLYALIESQGHILQNVCEVLKHLKSS